MPANTKYNLGAGERFASAFTSVALGARFVAQAERLGEQINRFPGAFVANTANAALNALQLNKYRGEAFDRDEPRGVSPIGLPMFDVLAVSAPIDYVFPLEPLIDLKETKRFLETETQSGREVVELVGIKPVELTIRGILWDGSGKYPEQQIRELRNLWKQDTILSVSSRVLNAYEVASIYIKDISYPAVPGFEDTVAYQITARSIRPVELELLES